MNNDLPNPPLAYFSVIWYLILLIVIVFEVYWNYIHPPFTKTFSIFVLIEIIFLICQTCCLCLYAYSTTQGCVIYLLQRFCDIVHILSLFMSYCVWGNGYFKNVTYGVKTAWNSLKAPYFILLAMILYDIISISLSISFTVLSCDCTVCCY
ncbi:hypothetical protein ENU1_029510 [Entamoeba nuttalli P19]|uniref:Transmembrane protein n=1 Tax=Entamoeba nuttalli (strain P19) TaxID=1076696 RepID=K2H3X7_ENTNP|nr:hypothetical protein ENU1_029510 [Entamoeba nuttalli P19]EKE42188.1 hypothetical protein ENU1_029510 [Entamoeba nuttalli P19]|eukprot:XP_008855477.1 hypothetical protein ENU1_029510 [Entamoeba nuttalli P19]